MAFKELKVGFVSMPPYAQPSANLARETFFTRLALHVERTPSLLALAEQCRKLVPGTVDEEAAAWAESAFVPHVSLVYAGLKAEDVCSSVLDRARADVAAAGLGFGNESALSGWEGGRLVLVQTWRRIEDWNIIAERVL